MKKFNDLRIHKPNKQQTGSASAFQLRIDTSGKWPKTLSFLQMAKQTGIDENDNARFGWKDDDTTIKMKLDETDLGKLLYGLRTKTEINLFHKNANGNTILKIVYKEDKGMFGIRLSKKVGQDQPVALQHFLSFDETELVRVYLDMSLKCHFGWWS